MAITIDRFELPITVNAARDFLQRETDSFGVFFDVDRCFELSAILQLENLDIIRKCRRISVNGKLDLNNKDEIINTLVKMGVNKTEFLITKPGKKNQEIAYNADVRQDILSNAAYCEEIREFIKLTATFASNKRNKGNIENFALLPQSVALSRNNRRMSRGCPTWSILNTSRIAASDPGIQGVPRSMSDIVCEPKGYTLKRCDSGQIEPRINFSTYLRDELIMNLIMAYDDAYFGLMHYCLMSDVEIQACRDSFEKNFRKLEITDEIKDSRQNIKRLTNAGSYGSSNLGDINPKLAKSYELRIVKHPARIKLERKVTQDVNAGINTFYGQFGTPVTPGETEKYKPGEKSWKEHVIRCGINNPVQTTASELMLFSINEARKVLSEAKDTHICHYKHDEACFYISDNDMANGVGDKLDEITAYNVKGWIPIRSDSVDGVKHGDYPSYIL